MPPEPVPPPEELILAMLRDVLARQATQMGVAVKPALPDSQPPQPPPLAPLTPAPPPAPRSVDLVEAPAAPIANAVTRLPQPSVLTTEAASDADPLSETELKELAEFEELARQPLAPSSLPRTLRLLLIGLLVFLFLINIPVFNGLALARALPDKQALIIRDGLLLKGSGPQVYVLENNHKRWVSSLDAFEHYGYQWAEVHVVEDEFLAQFPDGRPIHVLLKCQASPHIYRLENDRKRWIKDIPTFEAEGHVWEDVRFVSCEHLRNIPNGPPIPPDAGPPPQP